MGNLWATLWQGYLSPKVIHQVPVRQSLRTVKLFKISSTPSILKFQDPFLSSTNSSIKCLRQVRGQLAAISLWTIAMRLTRFWMLMPLSIQFILVRLFNPNTWMMSRKVFNHKSPCQSVIQWRMPTSTFETMLVEQFILFPTTMLRLLHLSIRSLLLHLLAFPVFQSIFRWELLMT